MLDPMRALIVDDDPDIHEFLRIALQTTGCYLESAWDGLQGLSKVESSHWDLVITDVIMPSMDGLELLERISVIRPELPVVVMTVDSTAGKIVSAIKKHAFGWLQKPFTMLAVQELVDSALTVSRLEDDIQVISATPQWLELRLRCDMKTAWRALHFVREMDPGLPDRENVALAFREVLFNAVEHGGGNDPNVHVTITYTRARGEALGILCTGGLMQRGERLVLTFLGCLADAGASHLFSWPRYTVILWILGAIGVGTLITAVHRTVWIAQRLKEKERATLLRDVSSVRQGAGEATDRAA